MENPPWRLIGRFNQQAQIFVAILLSGVVAVLHIFPSWELIPLLADSVVAFAILRLAGGYFWNFARGLKDLRTEFHALIESAGRRHIVTLARESLTWIAILFLFLWLSRWTRGIEEGLRLASSPHYGNFLDAALLSFLLSTLLGTEKIRSLVEKMKLHSGRQIMLLYFVAALSGTYLLVLPFSLNDGASLKLIDSLFITVSALAVTGLSPINVAEVLSPLGYWILLGLIQIGGLGIIVISSALALTAVQKLSLRAALINKELYDIPDLGNMTHFLRKVVALTLVMEILGTIVIYFSLPADMSYRFTHAAFHSVSAFCNAGFSTLPKNLEASPIAFPGLWMICLLIVVGGLGFPVLFEVIKEARLKRARFSANARLTLMVTGALLGLGSLLIFTLETVVHNPSLTVWERLGQSLFYSVSTRTAGFNMVPVDQFHISTILIMMGLMVIGGGPISTAGGIKTTTLGVLYSTALSSLLGRRKAQIYHREIPNSVLMRSVATVVLYFLVAILASLALFVSERVDSWALIFEVVSALSTVGLSLGITDKLTVFGKLVIIGLMIIGRLGLVSAIYAGFGKVDEQRYRYPEDRFFTG